MVEVRQEDREAAARYWGNDNPPLELQREFARHRIAALDAARGDAEPVAWMPIETAPKDGTAFQAIIPGHGADNVLCWTDGLIGSDGRDCGSWAFASDQEPPDCWTDGYCWEVNEDGVPSVQPTHWKPLHLPRGDQVARVVEWLRKRFPNRHNGIVQRIREDIAAEIERGELFND